MEFVKEVLDSRLLNVLELSQRLLNSMQIPLFARKHSRKTYTQHYLFKLLVAKTYLGMTYRGFEDYLATSILPEYLGQRHYPEFSTLQKFARRQNIQELEKMLLKFVDFAPKKTRNVGVDATGIKMRCASSHYEKRIGRIIKKKDFLKWNAVSDLDNQLYIAVKFRKRSRHDTMDLRPLWNKIKRVDFVRFFGDKGYDAEWFHEIVFRDGYESWIHLKNEDVPVHRTKGTSRKHMKRRHKNSEKGKRSLCETEFSSLKRMFGGTLKSKSLKMMKIELLFKIMTYNLDRIIKLEKKFSAPYAELPDFSRFGQNHMFESEDFMPMSA